MAPPSQKGTGKKGRDIRQSRSRNTTPSLVGNTSADTELGETAFLELQLAAFRTSDEIVEQYGAAIPSSKDLESLLERLKRLVDTVETRSAISDKGMRMASNLRKDRLEEIESERRDEEHRERIKKEAADEEERSRNKLKMKKRKEVSSAREERPLTHGAHGLAPQDGSNLGKFLTASALFISTLRLASLRRANYFIIRLFFTCTGPYNAEISKSSFRQRFC